MKPWQLMSLLGGAALGVGAALAFAGRRSGGVNLDGQRRADLVKPELRPFYEHLVHHAVWDAVGGSKTLHKEIRECMLQS